MNTNTKFKEQTEYHTKGRGGYYNKTQGTNSKIQILTEIQK